MKEKYETPMIEKIEFDYEDVVTASSGHMYRLYTDTYFGCHEKETDTWVNEPPTP